MKNGIIFLGEGVHDVRRSYNKLHFDDEKKLKGKQKQEQKANDISDENFKKEV